jgi:hypothetical protein
MAVDPRGRASCGSALALAQGVALELDALGVVHDTIEDGVGEGRLANDVVPAAHRQLAGEERRGASVAILDDLEEVAALLGEHGFWSPIVENQQMGSAEAAKQARVATIAAGEREVGEQPRQSLVEDRELGTRSVVAERRTPTRFCRCRRRR